MFKIGDKVMWTSQSCDIYTDKVGEVYRVIPPGEILKLTSREFARFRIMFDGGVRPHETYLISVPTGINGQGKPKLYWPRVTHLRRWGPSRCR